MHERPGTADSRAVSNDDVTGYPLREEATEPFPPPPPPATEPPGGGEIYAVAPAAPLARRRRAFPATNPWPWLIALILLLGGLGVAYAVTRPSSKQAAGPPPAVASPPAAPAPAPPPASAPPPSTHSQPQPPPPPPTARVPSLVGSSLPRAVGLLKQAGLTADVAHVDSNAPEGQVVGQNPMSGASVPKGGRVHLNVSTQPPVSVPDVTGIQGLQAVHTLEADHLVASLVYVPSTEPARRVIAQYPAAGTKVKRGTSIQINLSQGNHANKGASGPIGPTGPGG